VFELGHFTDYGLLLLRVITGATYIDSGYNDFRHLDARSKSIGMSRRFTAFTVVEACRLVRQQTNQRDVAPYKG
jgi:hypothetical protein